MSTGQKAWIFKEHGCGWPGRCEGRFNRFGSLLSVLCRFMGYWQGLQGSEVVEQQAMEEDVAASDFAQ